MYRVGDIIYWNIFLLPYITHWLLILDEGKVLHYGTDGKYRIETLDEALNRSWRSIHDVKLIMRTEITMQILDKEILDEYIREPYHVLYHSCQDFIALIVRKISSNIIITQYEMLLNIITDIIVRII